jgi:hypothetical protein
MQIPAARAHPKHALAHHGHDQQHAASDAHPAFTSIRAATCLSDFTYRMPSTDPEPGERRPSAGASPRGSASNDVRAMMTADARRDARSPGTPRSTEQRRDDAADSGSIASIADHVALDRALAVSNSRSRRQVRNDRRARGLEEGSHRHDRPITT